jgi:hypothetical protein
MLAGARLRLTPHVELAKGDESLELSQLGRFDRIAAASVAQYLSHG